MGPLIGVIVPSYGHFDYVAATIDSLFAGNSERFAVFLVGDASPEWGASLAHNPVAKYPASVLLGQLDVHQFKEHGGYIRSINEGARQAQVLQLAFASTNNF